jgi:hypothetical protein
MKRNIASIAGLVTAAIVAMLLLVTGSSNVRANDQPSAATAAGRSIISVLNRRRLR